MFEIDYPEILKKEAKPRYRIMSTYEQRKEPPDPKFQFLLFAAEPYETIAFKVPSHQIDFSEGKYFEQWDQDSRKYKI